MGARQQDRAVCSPVRHHALYRPPPDARPSGHQRGGRVLTATLHLLCGKIGAGKSTLAAELAKRAGTVLISEDFWLARLYPGEILTLEDQVRCSGRLCEAMAPHIVDLLRAGLSVVLDFHANTPKRRAWMRGIVEASGAAHTLHHLDVPDAECLARLHRRNEAGTHEYRVTDAEFELFTRYFVPPSTEEGFDVVVHRPI